MAIKSETKTLQLTFVDGLSKNVSYSISNPKSDLTKLQYICNSGYCSNEVLIVKALHQ